MDLPYDITEYIRRIAHKLNYDDCIRELRKGHTWPQVVWAHRHSHIEFLEHKGRHLDAERLIRQFLNVRSICSPFFQPFI